MKEKKRFGNLAILFMAGMVGMIALAGTAGATDGVHNINSGLNYTTIQAAIDNANAGDEIHVDSGIYYENVLVNKQLILKGVDTGAGKPIVDAKGIYSAITLSAGQTTLEGFVAANSSSPSITLAGILVRSDNNILKNNTATLNGAGIFLDSSNNNILSNNNVSSNSNYGITLHYSGNNILINNNAGNTIYGFYFYYSSNNVLSDNNASNNGFGFYLVSSNNNTLKNNNASNNSGTGIALSYSGVNKLENNIVNSNSYAGISLSDESNNNELNANNISNNIHGIMLSSWYNQFIGNLISQNNADGFFISNGYNNTIRENNISFSHYSIYTQGANNKIYHNNFVNISNNAYDMHGTDIWDNGYPSGGNYWSDYTGIDSNNDGIGDIPYNISGSTAQDRYPLMAPYNGTLINGCGVVTDYDSNIYDTIVEGNLCWLKSNLKSTHDASGNAITRYCYNGNSTNCDLRGGLYDWNTLMNGGTQCDGTSIDNPTCTVPVQGICPINWHIPSSYEYQNLGSVIGPSQDAFVGSTWANGIPGFYDGGSYYYWGVYADYWSSTNVAGNPSRFAYGGGEYHNTDSNYPSSYGFSARCVKNIISMPTQPSDLTQLKSDGSTAITIGGTTSEKTVVFKGRVIDFDNDRVKLQVELRNSNEYDNGFNESKGGLKESTLVSNGSEANITVTDLIDGNYHWRARTEDEHGNKSEWVGFGKNPTSEADFTVSVPEFQNFSLAVIADPHLGYYVLPSGDFGYTPGMEKSVTSFTDKLQEIKGQNVEQIAVPGDLVQHRKPEFFTAFKNLVRGFNVNATPGNHDRRTLLWGNDSTNYQNIINPKLDWNFSYKGINIIGLNSGADYNIQEIPESPAVAALMLYLGMTPESDGLTDSQWNKLNNGEFSQAGQRQIIVMHSPVMNINNDTYAGDQVLPVPLDGGPGGNNEAIAHHRADVINYTVNNLVELVLSGHTHKNAIFNATGDQVENTTSDRPLFIQTSNEGYRIVEVKDGKANPFETKIPGVKNRKSSTIFVSYANASGPFAQFGLHAYDSQKRHTGPAGLSCSGEFESGIPDSYYTGSNLGVSSVPETLVGYSSGAGIKIEVTEFKVIPIQCPLSGAPGTSAVKSAQSAGNAIFNQTITDQTDTSTTEIAFYNVTLEENSSASVNVTNMTGYKMEVDLTGDGIIDQIVIPDSVSAANNQPQQNISIIPYDGNGTINLSVNAGNITSAGSMNVSMFPEKQFYEFTHGLIAVGISDLVNGSTVNITIELPQNLSVNAQFWEYGKTAANNTSRWYRIPFGSNDGDNIITLEIEDGGAGDDDGIENGAIITTGGPGITSVPGISGRVIDSAGKTGIAGATVSTNISNSTTTDSLGFYSLSVPEGEYILTVSKEPTHYPNSTVQVSTIGIAVAEQDIELQIKPTGTITGDVRN